MVLFPLWNTYVSVHLHVLGGPQWPAGEQYINNSVILYNTVEKMIFNFGDL